MSDPLTWLIVMPVAVFAGTIGGVVGFGSAVILVPVCTYAFGPQRAVPILTLAALLGNLSRAAFSWKETDWSVVAVYSAAAVPGAALGALLFVQLDALFVQRVMGAFIIAMIPARRWAESRQLRVRRAHLAVVGAVMGILSGIVGTAGPVNAPFFLWYGLTKGAYLATEALGASAVHLTKTLVYGRFAALTVENIAAGITIGVALLIGSYMGRRIIDRIEVRTFQVAVEALLAISGVLMVTGMN